MATKITAARLATAAGVTTIIAHSSKPSNIFLIVSYIERLKTYPNTPANELEHPGPRTPEDPVANNHHVASVLDLKSRPNTRPPSPAPFSKVDYPRHTRFLPKPRTIKDRKFWILYGLAPHGSVFIDEGAYRAMTRTSRAGLLPVGVVGVSGNFAQQEPVRLVVVKRPKQGEDLKKSDMLEGDEVGRAIVNYSSVEIAMIKGCQSKEIFDILGYAGTFLKISTRYY